MADRAFNLLNEQWICVMNSDYKIEKVSLIDVFKNAHHYQGLAGETETQNVAMLRFLLAVLHSVFYRVNEDGKISPIESQSEALRRWEAIWNMRNFPEKPITDYLNQWEDRFWLFDDEHPFYQVPKITGTDNKAQKLNGEIVESNNKIQLFSLRSGKSKSELNYDEAARWLIHLQTFGDAAPQNPRPKQSWVGKLGVVLAKGKTLFETMMFNFVLIDNNSAVWEEPKPAWELPQPQKGKLIKIPLPNNQAELLTLQCRRVLLHYNNGIVTDYVEAAGDCIEEENAFSEQMTYWCEKKKGKETLDYYPREHDPSKQMWRDFSVMLGEGTKMPGVVFWTKKLKEKGKIAKNKVIAFQIVRVTYGKAYCGVTDEFSDELKFHTGLLEELGKKWVRHITDEIERCDMLAKAISQLSLDLNKAIGGDGVFASQQAKEQCYYRFDIPFRNWLLEIDPENQKNMEIREKREQWENTAKRIVLDLGRELVEKAGTAALVGKDIVKDVNGKKIREHYCAATAFNKFLYQISREERK